MTPSNYAPHFLYFKSLDDGSLSDSATSHNFNSVLYPVFAATATDAIQNMYYMCDSHDNLISSRQAWHNGCGIYSLCLNLPDKDVKDAATGMDTRGASAQMSFHLTSTKTHDAATVLIACETTSTLKIGAGRNVSVSY